MFTLGDRLAKARHHARIGSAGHGQAARCQSGNDQQLRVWAHRSHHPRAAGVVEETGVPIAWLLETQGDDDLRSRYFLDDELVDLQMAFDLVAA